MLTSKMKTALGNNRTLTQFMEEFKREEQFEGLSFRCRLYSDLQTEPVGESSMRTNNILNFNVGLDKATHIDILTIQLCPLKFIMGPAKIFVGLFEHEEVNADSLVKFSDTCSEFEQTVARAENYLLSAPNNQRNSVLQFVNTVRNFNQNNRKTFNKIIWMTRAAFYLCSNCMDCEKNIQSKGSRISRVVILSSSMPPC